MDRQGREGRKKVGVQLGDFGFWIMGFGLKANSNDSLQIIFPKENRYFETDNGILYCGDSLSVLKSLPDESIDCVVTSPPYWGLRDYGVEGQLGLEPTFQEYLEKLWAIFDEIYRVLKPTGTCWVNLGDTYMNNSSYSSKGRVGYNKKEGMIYKKDKSIKQKSLCLIPQRFAIGMVDRGWILRNDLIWAKPNPLPESVKDRFTKSHEYIFFFTKQKKYHFEQILEPANYDGKKKVILEPSEKYGNRNFTLDRPQGMARGVTERWPNKINGEPARNKRDVWIINTKPFKDAHFAVFPPEIPEICIKAGCPKDGIVLDPFAGSGTTLLTAEKMFKRWIGIELNPKYCEMAKNRLTPYTKRMRLI